VLTFESFLSFPFLIVKGTGSSGRATLEAMVPFDLQVFVANVVFLELCDCCSEPMKRLAVLTGESGAAASGFGRL
jgi:hypothetical protein